MSADAEEDLLLLLDTGREEEGSRGGGKTGKDADEGATT